MNDERGVTVALKCAEAERTGWHVPRFQSCLAECRGLVYRRVDRELPVAQVRQRRSPVGNDVQAPPSPDSRRNSPVPAESVSLRLRGGRPVLRASPVLLQQPPWARQTLGVQRQAI